MRIIAFLLSLIQPGAGHFFLGNFRRGLIWAVGVAGVGLLLLFVLPVGLLALALAPTVGIVGRVASAVDAVTLTARRPRWVTVVVACAALIAGGMVVGSLAANNYRTHYAQAFTIPSGNMMDTLLVGDYILVDKSVYRTRNPQRGDIIVFSYPLDERRDFIKRIVATPGERIQIRGHQVLIDGKPLPEPYTKFADSGVRGGEPYCGYAYSCEPTTVPPDSYFVMGDNRANSQDSRYWGFVKRSKIKGKAALIYWSWDGDRHWFRWGRVGQSIS